MHRRTKMIYTCSIRNLNEFDSNTKKYAIVRSLKRPINGVTQLDILSPSKNLLYAYLRIKDAGKWNKDSFEQIYRPQFLHEMQSPEAQKMLRTIVEQSKQQDVVLACFCDNVQLCHRSIVAELLHDLGAEIGYVK